MKAKPLCFWSSVVKKLEGATSLFSAAFAASLITVFELPVSAQPTVEWQAVFGGTNYDQIDAIVETPDQGAILGGYSESGMNGNKTSGNFGFADYWIVRVDANGSKQWERSFGGTSNDFFHAIQPTSDGGYLLAGSSYSPISGNKTNGNFGQSDHWLVKIDTNGDKQWEKVYGGMSYDFVETMEVAGDGNFIVAGDSASAPSGNKTTGNSGGYDFWAVKVNEINGEKMWERSYGGTMNDYCYAVLPTDDGGCLLGGESSSGISGNKSTPNNGFYDFWLMKLNSDGNKEWERIYGGTNNDWLVSIAPTSDKGWILGGTSRSGISGNKTTASLGFADYWVIKVDSDGTKQWEKAYGGDDSDYLDSVLPTPDGNFLISGFSYSGVSGNKASPNRGTNNEDGWVIKIDPDGNKLWEETYGGDDWDDFYVAKVLKDGSYLIGGSSISPVSGNKTVAQFGEGDVWVMKLASEMLPEPLLTISRTAADVMITWPSPSTGFELERNLDLTTTNWTSVNTPVVDDGTNKTSHDTIGPDQVFYRLKKP